MFYHLEAIHAIGSEYVCGCLNAVLGVIRAQVLGGVPTTAICLMRWLLQSPRMKWFSMAECCIVVPVVVPGVNGPLQ